jgi:hypothetical protein
MILETWILAEALVALFDGETVFTFMFLHFVPRYFNHFTAGAQVKGVGAHS